MNCKNPCPECPWKKGSLRGYLGGNDVETYAITVHRETRLACHMRNPDAVEKNPSKITAKELCIGYVMALNNDCKRAIDPVLRKAQDQYREHPMRGDIFGFPVYQNFKEHHEVA